MSRKLVVALVALVVVVVAAVVAVGVVVSRGGGDTDDLAARVVTAAPGEPVVVVDVDEAREAAGVDDDATRADVYEAGGDRRFLAVTVALPHWLSARGDAGAIDETLDLSAMSAIASSRRTGAAVVATDQSWDEIADGLLEVGYERDGDLLTPPEPANPNEWSYTAISYRDGLLALSSDRERGADVVAELLDDPAARGDVLDRLGDLDGPVRAYVPVDEERAGDAACVSGYAVDDPLSGAVTLRVYSEAADDLELRVDSAGGLLDRLDLGEPDVRGDEVDVAVTGDDDVLVGGPLGLLISPEYLSGDLFGCP